MSDTKSSMGVVRPEPKETVTMEPPPTWAIALAEKVANGFERVNSDMAVVKTRQELQAAQMQDLGGHIGRLDERVSKLEGRTDTASVRVRAESDVNLKQDSVIATLLTRLDVVEANQETAAKERAETAAKVAAIHDSVVGVIKNPKVKFVGRVLFGIAMAYAAAKGIKVLP